MGSPTQEICLRIVICDFDSHFRDFGFRQLCTVQPLPFVHEAIHSKQRVDKGRVPILLIYPPLVPFPSSSAQHWARTLQPGHTQDMAPDMGCTTRCPTSLFGKPPPPGVSQVVVERTLHQIADDVDAAAQALLKRDLPAAKCILKTCAEDLDYMMPHDHEGKLALSLGRVQRMLGRLDDDKDPHNVQREIKKAHHYASINRNGCSNEVS